MDTERRQEHARNPRLEALLQELNGLLAEGEARAVEGFSQPQHPVVFVVGCARSGTTLALQYLAATGLFGYPSNLIARFYNAPYIGARIQQMLTDSDYDFAGELTGGAPAASQAFGSRLGKTRGALSPSEFWYFWRRFFPPQEIQRYHGKILEAADTARFVAEIAALESVNGLPVAMKGLYLNWNIDFLSRLFDKAVFLQVRRHPFYNMQSLLRARVSFFGREESWYSFKPPEYDRLRHCTVEQQLAGQVFHTDRAVSEGVAALPPERRLVVDYESLCERPAGVLQALADRLGAQGASMEVPRHPVGDLRANCTLDLPQERARALIDAYRSVSGETLELL